MTTSASTPTIISSVPELEAFLSSIPASSTLYLDFEGNNLSRHGTTSLITVLVHPQEMVRLIDVLVLGKQTFTTTSSNGKTLKSILEDPSIPKCLWDVRNDADALWALYRIDLAGITDIQLLENASRTGDKTYVRGLDKCVQFDLKSKLGFMEITRWLRAKKEIVSSMPYGIFTTRPLDAKTIQYCVNDVVHLPELHALYLARMTGEWLFKSLEESTRRVAEAHAPGYDPQSASKKLGPWGSGQDKRVLTTDQWFEMLEEQREEELAQDMFGDDDVCYYDYDEDDWGGNNAADGAFDAEALDSCWDRNS
jgi:exonuclease 3'-5' domain-containing protein 1